MKVHNSVVCLLYSESDKAIANLLENALSYYSIDIWKAQNISIGSQIISETTKVLQKAKFIIVLWSKTSIKSALLKDLALEAKRNKKVLIPVLIENVNIPGEFLDIQPANLVGWDGDKENEQIVKLWRLIQDRVLRYRRKIIGFNQLIGIFSLLLTGIGVIFTITTPEVRCWLKLQCPENQSSINTLKSSATTSPTPSETFTQTPSQTTERPQSTFEKSSPSISPATTPTTQQTVEIEGLIFKLQSCNKLNQRLKCNFLIRNIEKDREITLYSYLFENPGGVDPEIKSYRGKFIDLGGNIYDSESVEISGSKSNTYIRLKLIQNVDIKASLNFKEIPSQVNQIKVIEIPIGLDSIMSVQFRDIILSK